MIKVKVTFIGLNMFVLFKMRFLKNGSLCIAWPNLHTHAITSLQSRKTWGLNFGIIKSTRTRWHGGRLVANTKGFPSLVNFQRHKVQKF